MNRDIEHCIECDEPTGRAGIDEDSLYVEFSPIGDAYGPLCEECYGRYMFSDDHAVPVLTPE